MDKLTAKQEAFCQYIADGMSQADAYRNAYDAADSKDETIYPNASRLASDSKVAARIEELKSGLQEKQLWTREMSVKALVQAYREGNGAAKVSAVKELNAMHGYNEPQKIQVGGLIFHKVERVVTDPANKNAPLVPSAT